MNLLSRTKEAFTIVELLIVIGVIGVLATISIVAYGGVQKNARDASILSDIDSFDASITRTEMAGAISGWFSGPTPTSSPYGILPSKGNIVDVVAGAGEYCIRAYNPNAIKNSITNSSSKGSTSDACINLPASTAAGGVGGSITDWWKLDGNGVNAVTGRTNGVVTAAVATTNKDNRPNKALEFNGTSAFVDFGATDDYNNANFSVSVWAESDVVNPGHVRNLVGKGNWNETNNWFIGFRGSGSEGVTATYGLATWAAGPMVLNSTFNPTLWHHYVATVSAGQQRLYIDGILVSTVNSTHVATTNTYNLQIARSSYSATFFDGKIDDVRLFNTTLPPDAVSAMYAAGPV